MFFEIYNNSHFASYFTRWRFELIMSACKLANFLAFMSINNIPKSYERLSSTIRKQTKPLFSWPIILNLLPDKGLSYVIIVGRWNCFSDGSSNTFKKTFRAQLKKTSNTGVRSNYCLLHSSIVGTKPKIERSTYELRIDEVKFTGFRHIPFE